MENARAWQIGINVLMPLSNTMHMYLQRPPMIHRSKTPRSCRDPIAYFLTWTTYGAWLPGDPRGWVDSGGRIHSPDPGRAAAAQSLLRETPLTLDWRSRSIVERCIREHCRVRGWVLHVMCCRTQHIHMVVTATQHSPMEVMRQCKSWATRGLASGRTGSREAARRTRWWGEGGSGRHVYSEQELMAVIEYVVEAQDKPRDG